MEASPPCGDPCADPGCQLTGASASRTWSASYKARVLAEYESLDKAGKGALLRREGLYTSLISAWRQQRDQGALQALAVVPCGRPLGRDGTQPPS
jgi:transposase